MVNIKNRLTYLSIFGDNGLNEDMCGFKDGFYWVLDGATGLNEKNLIDENSDARWYTNWWNNYLHYTLRKGKKIEDVISDGISQIREEFLTKVGVEDIHKINFPSASIAIVEVDGDYLRYFILGDCRIYIKDDDKTTVIMDDKVNILDEKVFDEMRNIEDFSEMPLFISRQKVLPLIVENRLKNNTDDGYWILSFLDESAEKALKGEVCISNNSKIMICSDGYYAISDKYGLYDEDSIMDATIEKGILGIAMELRFFEGCEEKISKVPRFKDRDDCTALMLERL